MRVQVAIIGGGPSGLFLARKLSLANINCIILEKHSREYVLSRIRAGVLEQGTVNQLRQANISAQLDRVGLVHHGCQIADDRDSIYVNFQSLVGNSVMVYGQTEVTRDLYNALEQSDIDIRHNAQDVSLAGIDSDSPTITWKENGITQKLTCDYVAGCDGFYGPSRNMIPSDIKQEFLKSYPFGWLGILSETPPVSNELIYSRSRHGFALASMRNPNLSRYYLQVPKNEHPDHWNDNRFWDELKKRLPDHAADTISVGASIEKSVAQLRSFVCEPMAIGRLFLCGDAAHIVPPTGAKGLNLAISDVHYLFEALQEYYYEKSCAGLQNYSKRALKRVWKTMRFSWWMTNLLHQFPHQDSFEKQIQNAEFDHLKFSEAAQRLLAENYTGIPY